MRVSWGLCLHDGPYLDRLAVKFHAFTAPCTALLQFSTGAPSRLSRWLPARHIHIADLETSPHVPAGCHHERISTNTHKRTRTRICDDPLSSLTQPLMMPAFQTI